MVKVEEPREGDGPWPCKWSELYAELAVAAAVATPSRQWFPGF